MIQDKMKHASPRGANEWKSSTKEQRKQQQSKTKIDILFRFRTQVPDAPHYTKPLQKRERESSTKEKQNKEIVGGITGQTSAPRKHFEKQNK